MEQKRFFTFLLLTLAIFWSWQIFFVPKNPPAPAAKPQAEQDVAKKAPDAAAKPEIAAAPEDKSEKPATEAAPPPADLKPEKHEHKTIVLGSLLDDPGYRFEATITSRGAAVQDIQLNDPRYRELEAVRAPPPAPKKFHPPLKIVGNLDGAGVTLRTAIPHFGVDLIKSDWEVVALSPEKAPHDSVTFRMKSPDSKLEVLKTYRVNKIDPKAQPPESPAYELHMDLTLRNRGGEARTLSYDLQGPAGLPLENVENTQKFRDVVVGFLNEDASVTAQLLAGKTIADNKPEEWKQAFKYIGVDVQYFAALLLPVDDQLKTPYIKSATQQVVGAPVAEKSDVSVLLTSVDLELPAGEGETPGEISHKYRLFAGPKRDELLANLGAPKVIDYGTFAWISRPMLDLLKVFHSIFGNFGIAIICLTVVVRGCLFPLSIKQARSAAKMQELQPEITALREKHGKDKEKMAKAQMELFSKHNYNPFSGCLPIFLQLPIFMGLYNSLSHAVDLRMAKFLWMENLAGPDALFHLPTRIPFIGSEFNLLPIITIFLFLAQQKMFMPPALNDEQKMQQKMMNFMTVAMGFMFYKVPSGLCVYFIASSLWGMAERKLLPRFKHAPATPAPAASTPVRTETRPDDSEPAPEGFLAKLLKAADKQVSARRGEQDRRK